MYGCVVSIVGRRQRFALVVGAISADRAERQALVLVRLLTGSDMGAMQLESLFSLGAITFEDDGEETRKRIRHFYSGQRTLGRVTFKPDSMLSKVFSNPRSQPGKADVI